MKAKCTPTAFVLKRKPPHAPRLLPLCGSVKRAFNLDNVVLIQSVDFDNRSGRIWSGAPKLLLYFIDYWPEAKHVSDVDDQTNGIAKRSALGRGNQLHVFECLHDPCLFAGNECVGRRIDAAHARDENEVSGSRAQIPRTGWLDCARRIERLDAVW